jgi:predicted ester cyclase
MNVQKQNKELILRYFNAISGKPKTLSGSDEWMTDQHLREHIAFFESIFPCYEIYADEMTAEGDRVIVRARMKGVHQGTFHGIPPTYKEVEMPFAISYTISNGKIMDHWLIADSMELLEQLGLEKSNKIEQTQ